MYMRSVMSAPRSNGNTYPFISVGRALRSLDDMFAAATETSAMPVRLDVREDDKAFHVSADLPGLSEKEVEVTFDEGLLTIRGEKKVSREEKEGKWHMVERSTGSFARQLSLGDSIDAAAIEAKFEKGVLSVTLPKQPQEQTTARKIEIKAS